MKPENKAAKELTTEQALMLVKSMGFKVQDTLNEIPSDVQSADVNRIIIPRTMSKLDASLELKKQYENEEQEARVATVFEGWHYKDALVAIHTVTEQIFGWIQGVATMFSTPTTIEVTTDVVNGKPVVSKAYFGKMQISAWDDCILNVHFTVDGNIAISGDMKKKFHSAAQGYFEAIRQHLFNHSIYKGKSVVVTCEEGDDRLNFEIVENKVNPRIILNKEEELVINNFVISALKEPGKRCHLFTGSYGNGKTETAMRVGKAGNANNMTFFYLKDAACFEKMLNCAKQYQPCIVFVEDIDEIASGEQRDASMNKILNTLDGVQTKGNNLTVIFTTNHANKINAALRRPGRIDTVIEFRNPDKDTAEKILKSFFSELPGNDTLDYTAILDKMPNIQGAVIAEICKRSVKLATLEGRITTDQVLAAIASMRYQIDLMNEPVSHERKEVTLINLLKEVLSEDL